MLISLMAYCKQAYLFIVVSGAVRILSAWSEKVILFTG
jgi:hypothetical protein